MNKFICNRWNFCCRYSINNNNCTCDGTSLLIEFTRVWIIELKENQRNRGSRLKQVLSSPQAICNTFSMRYADTDRKINAKEIKIQVQMYNYVKKNEWKKIFTYRHQLKTLFSASFYISSINTMFPFHFFCIYFHPVCYAHLLVVFLMISTSLDSNRKKDFPCTV